MAQQRHLLLVFGTEEDLRTGATALRRMGLTSHHLAATSFSVADAEKRAVDARGVSAVRTWLRRTNAAGRTLIIATRAEVTVREKTTAALASLNVKLPQVLWALSGQIFILDLDHRMIAFFGRWPTRAPIPLERLLGKRKREVFGDELGAVHEEASRRALEGQEVTFEWTIPNKSRPIHLMTTASALRDDDSRIVGVLLVTRDISELKLDQMRMQAALDDKNRELVRLEKALGSARAGTRNRRSAAPPYRVDPRSLLSARQIEVLDLLGRGVRIRSISERLGISVETARRHVKAMFRKTGVHSQESLVQNFFNWELPPRASVKPKRNRPSSSSSRR